VQGSIGVQGTIGTGAQGTQGTSGARGFSGDAGAQGVQGRTGLQASNLPTSSSSPGTVGDIAYNNNFFYICVATNTWLKISANSTF
jgi:hypothetical protein